MIAEGFVLKRRFLKCGKKLFVIITFLQLAAIVSLRKKNGWYRHSDVYSTA